MLDKEQQVYIYKTADTIITDLRAYFNTPNTSVINSNLYILNSLFRVTGNKDTRGLIKMERQIKMIEKNLDHFICGNNEKLKSFKEDVNTLLTTFRAAHYKLRY